MPRMRYEDVRDSVLAVVGDGEVSHNDLIQQLPPDQIQHLPALVARGDLVAAVRMIADDQPAQVFYKGGK